MCDVLDNVRYDIFHLKYVRGAVAEWVRSFGWRPGGPVIDGLCDVFYVFCHA